MNRVRIMTACLTAGLAFAGLAAAKQPQPPSRFTLLPDESDPTITTERGRVSARTGVPAALYGVRHPVEPGEPEAMARQYLREAAAELGLEPDALGDLRLRATRQGLATTTVRFDQTYSGVPVYGAELAVTLDRSPKVTFVMNGYRPGVAAASVIPAIGADAARAAVLKHLETDDMLAYEKTDIVVYHNRDVSRLAWRVRAHPAGTRGGDWEVLVDARSGTVFRAEDRACYGTVNGSGQVFNNDPLASAGANYGDPGFVDGGDADTPQLTAQLQGVTLTDIDLTAGMHTLVGPFAAIVDFEAPFNGLFAQAGSAFNFTRSPNGFEAANTYYHIDTVMRYINGAPPAGLGFTIMPYQYAGGVRFDPHALNGADNSYYSSATGRVAFGEGGVDDAEDADVVIHELGHGLHDWVTSGGLSQVQGLSEGSGDYIAQSYARAQNQWLPGAPQYHWVFGWDGHNPFWGGRTTNWPNLYPGGLVGQIHTDGQIWATALMRIWNIIGRQKTDAAFFEGLGMTTGSSSQQDAAQAVVNASASLPGYTPAEQYAIYSEFRATGYLVTPVPVELERFSVE